MNEVSTNTQSIINMSDWTNSTLEELRRAQTARKERLEPKLTDIPEKYANRLNEPQKRTLDEISEAIQRRVKRKSRNVSSAPIDYQAARYVVWQAIQATLKDKKEKFNADGNLKEVLPELIRYFIADPECKYDLQKGLYLWGDVGRGKTFLLRILKAFCDELEFKARQFRIYNAIDLESEILQTESFRILSNFKKGVWCFDDAGQERPGVAIFGNSFSVFGEIIATRYNEYIKVGTVTHLTSNVPPQLILDRFGHRLQSRCNEMFNFIKLEGKDKRAQL